jgi:hypothetical protein
MKRREAIDAGARNTRQQIGKYPTVDKHNAV